MILLGQSTRFGKLLREERIRSGLTQKELADFATVSVRAIRDIESGRAERSRPRTVRLLGDALGLQGPRRDAFVEAAATRSATAEVDRPVKANLGRAGAAETVTSASATSAADDPELRDLAKLLNSERRRQVSAVDVAELEGYRLVIAVARQTDSNADWSILWVNTSESA